MNCITLLKTQAARYAIPCGTSGTVMPPPRLLPPLNRPSVFVRVKSVATMEHEIRMKSERERVETCVRYVVQCSSLWRGVGSKSFELSSYGYICYRNGSYSHGYVSISSRLGGQSSWRFNESLLSTMSRFRNNATHRCATLRSPKRTARKQ